MQKKILINVPRVSIVPFPNFMDLYNGPETMVAGMYTPVFGDISGSILLIFPKDDAMRVVDLLWGQTIGTTKTFKEKDRELLRQAANILVASYLSALTKFVKLTSLAASSAISLDMLGAIVDAIVIEANIKPEEAVLVETDLVVSAHRVKGLMLFIPDYQSIDKILQKIKAE